MYKFILISFAVLVYLAGANSKNNILKTCATEKNYNPFVLGKAPSIPKKMHLIDAKNYIRNVAQEFVYALEDYGLNNLAISDFNQKISASYFGVDVIGNVTYSNGFIDSIASASLVNYSEQSILELKDFSGVIYCKIILGASKIYFNFRANLTTEYIAGTVGIPSGALGLTLYVYKSFKLNQMWAKIGMDSLGSQGTWDFFPASNVTEILRREMTLPNSPSGWTYSFWDDFKKLTNSTFLDLLTQVSMKIPYPEICFHCAGT